MLTFVRLSCTFMWINKFEFEKHMPATQIKKKTVITLNKVRKEIKKSSREKGLQALVRVFQKTKWSNKSKSVALQKKKWNKDRKY